ncbi:MAG TPA: glycosyltransferase family 4 protein, partial [Thermoflexales bacterium]|nr:glycosyltransferase family 4 protein [Thermoflexales bacterium]
SASTLEGLPTVLMEAMAVGMPIVATAIDGNTDLVQDGVTGVLAQPGNPESLAQAIMGSLAHPSRSANMAQTAKERVMAFSLDAIARQYEALYKDIVLGERVSRV